MKKRKPVRVGKGGEGGTEGTVPGQRKGKRGKGQSLCGAKKKAPKRGDYWGMEGH